MTRDSQRLAREAWAKEVDRRIAEDERGEVKMIPGEEVIAELRRKYSPNYRRAR